MNEKQRIFKRSVLKGNSISDSMKIAGYSTNKKNVYGSVLMRKLGIREAIEHAGLNDNSIAHIIKDNILAGSTIKATSDSARGYLELALKLRGDLKENTITDTTNIYINELKTLDDKSLIDKLKAIDSEIIE